MWSFAEIQLTEPQRALALENAPPADVLLAAIIDKFRYACASRTLRLGMEQSEKSRSDRRAVLQFHIGVVLSDQFFNSKSGYRAHFRQDWRIGLSYNEGLIALLRTETQSRLAEEVEVRLLSPTFDDCGALRVHRSDIFTSLDPGLSKVWFCARLISPSGRIVELPTGTVGPRLLLEDGTSWATVSRDDCDAWLDIKGAFLGSGRLYQTKDPIARATKLHVTGEA